MKKFLSLLLCAVMALSVCLLSACGGNDDDDLKGESEELLPILTQTVDFTVPEDFKIGLICQIDENSTYDLNFLQSMERVKTILNLRDDQVIIKKKVPESDKCYDEACLLARQGCDFIFANSFGHEPHLLKAAKEYPDVQFCHATGTQAHTAGVANFHDAFASIYEGRFLSGLAAGMKLNEMIADGKITADQAILGYIGAFEYAEVKSGLTAFYLGAKYVCPSVTMKVKYTNSWFDYDLEAEAASALISKGCVIISQHADSMGAPNVCEANGVPNVTYNGSTYDACPDTYLISSSINWTPYFLYVIGQIVKGEEIGSDWCGGMSENSVVLAGLNLDLAAEGTYEALKQAIKDIEDGKLHVFDVERDNYITVGGQKLTSYTADVDDAGDRVPETEAVSGGYFHESEYRSAPYFDVNIDGIENLSK